MLLSRKLQSVNTNTNNQSNSRPNSMNNGSVSSRPNSNVAGDRLYEIQPFKILVKKDTGRADLYTSKKETQNLRNKSHNALINTHREKYSEPSSNRVNSLEQEHDIGDGKAIGNVKWQLDEQKSGQSSLDNFNKKISEAQDEYMQPNEVGEQSQQDAHEKRVISSASTGYERMQAKMLARARGVLRTADTYEHE